MKRPLAAIILGSLLFPVILSGENIQALEAPRDHQVRPDQGPGPNWKAHLGLTDDQVKEVEAARSANRAALQPLRDQRRRTIETLKSQIKGKAPDSEIQSTLNHLKSIQEDIHQQEEKSRSRFADILTPTQRAKMLLGGTARAQRGWRDQGQKPTEAEDGEMPGTKANGGNAK